MSRVSPKNKKVEKAAATSSIPSPVSEPDSLEVLILKAGLIILAALFVFSPAFHGTWLWDDDQEIFQNAVLPDPMGLWKIWFAPTGADYLPLKTTVIWLLWRVFHNEPTGYHLVSIGLHIVGSLMVWRLFSRLGMRAAWLGGLLFAVHPMIVESVSWVSELKNTLSLPLLLLAMFAFLNFDETKRQHYYVLSIVLFLAAILCKSAVIMFPFVIVLYAWWKRELFTGEEFRAEVPWIRVGTGIGFGLLVGLPIGAFVSYWLQPPTVGVVGTPSEYFRNIMVLLTNSDLKAAREIMLYTACSFGAIGALVALLASAPKFCLWLWGKLWFAAPFFVVSLVIGLVTIYNQHGRAIGTETIPVGGIVSRTATAGLAIIFYFFKCVLPQTEFISGWFPTTSRHLVEQIPIYPVWKVDPPAAWMFLAWVVIAAVLWAMWRKKDTWGRPVLLGLGFFLINIFPVLGFITMSYMRITWVSDHFVYLPIIGLIGLLTAGMGAYYETLTGASRRLAIVACAFFFGLMILQSQRYSGVFAGEEEMWSYTLARNPNAWQAHSRYGKVKIEKGQQEEAFFHLSEAARLRPDLAETHNNLGAVLEQRGRTEEALEQIRKAHEIAPDILIYEVNLANLMVRMGRHQEASEHFRELLKKEPNNPTFLCNYGVTLYFLGQNDDAIEYFNRALQLNPELKDAKENLATALKKKRASTAPQSQPAGPAASGFSLSSTAPLQLNGP